MRAHPKTFRYVRGVYDGSDGDATRTLYDQLTKLGPLGIIGVNLFRAQKNSARAKVYRGGIRGKGSFKAMAYERKAWAMDNLARALSEHAQDAGITWGWGVDESEAKHSTVLYIDLPTGQVSFHTEHRSVGPEYAGKWDGVRNASIGRVCAWIAILLTGVAGEEEVAA